MAQDRRDLAQPGGRRVNQSCELVLVLESSASHAQLLRHVPPRVQKKTYSALLFRGSANTASQKACSQAFFPISKDVVNDVLMDVVLGVHDQDCVWTSVAKNTTGVSRSVGATRVHRSANDCSR